MSNEISVIQKKVKNPSGKIKLRVNADQASNFVDFVEKKNNKQRVFGVYFNKQKERLTLNEIQCIVRDIKYRDVNRDTMVDIRKRYNIGYATLIRIRDDYEQIISSSHVIPGKYT